MKILHETIHWITQGVLLWKQIVDSTTDFHSPKLRGRPILREVQNLRATTSTMSWTSTLIYACRIMYIYYILLYTCSIYYVHPNVPFQKCEQKNVSPFVSMRTGTDLYTYVQTKVMLVHQTSYIMSNW